MADTPHMLRNRLGEQTSLYLRQHATNPVYWQPWDEEALGIARQLDRPIFLSIGYSSCHWCHVMEHEVFESPEAAAVLNAEFVSIKVDREERPDLDAAYMAALMSLRGQGGWPASLWLTPALEPFYAATYVPREAFVDVCARLAAVYREQREEVVRAGREVAEAVARARVGSAGSPLPEVPDVVAGVLASVDRRLGGLRGAMKFPTPCVWTFLLRHARRTGDRACADAVRVTLDAMATGGIRDHLAGGFHRYATDREWLIPHFEKMLYDNAQLASLYLEASVALDDARYAEVARETLDFLLRETREPGGAFVASFDADSGGGEGSYYLWSREELLRVAGPDDGSALSAMLRPMPEGPAGVLTRRVGDEAPLLRHRSALLAERAGRPAPTRDPKVVTSWNGLAISALARGAMALGEPAYLEAARAAAVFVLETRWHGERLARTPDAPGVLDDYAFLADGLLDLHAASGEARWLAGAVSLLEAVLRRFSREGGGLHLTEAGGEAPLGRLVAADDGAEPSGGAIAARAMLRAATLTGRDDLADAARAALATQAEALAQYPAAAAAWAEVLTSLRAGRSLVTIRCEEADSDPLVAAVRALLPSDAELLVMRCDGESEAVVCREGACLPAARSVEDLLGLMRSKALAP